MPSCSESTAHSFDEEIYRVTEFLKEQGKPEYVDGVTDAPEEEEEEVEETASARNDGNELYDKAVQLVTTENRPSISYLQRRLGIGYNRAANLIEKWNRRAWFLNRTAWANAEFW